MSAIGSIGGYNPAQQITATRAIKSSNQAPAKTSTTASEEQAESTSQEAAEHDSSGSLNVVA